jgi:hypothetical protein
MTKIIINGILLTISSVTFLLLLGTGLAIFFDDLDYHKNTVKSVGVLIYNTGFIIFIISFFSTIYFGSNILKIIRDVNYLKQIRFLYVLPLISIIISILGIVFFSILSLYSGLLHSEEEAAIGYGYAAYAVMFGGLASTILLCVIGLLIDKHRETKK